MSNTDVTNPGSVNVADESYPSVRVDQTISSGPSQNAGPLVDAGEEADGPVSVDQCITVTPASTAQLTVDADVASPESPNCENTTENTVVGQVYGQGQPIDVYV